MTPEVHQEIEALRKQKTKALKARYRTLFGEDSRSSNHAHLFRRIAWRLQALAEGDSNCQFSSTRTALVPSGRHCGLVPRDAPLTRPVDGMPGWERRSERECLAPFEWYSNLRPVG
jgi:hypothetical protein